MNYFLIIKYKSIGASIATVLSELVVILIQLRLIKDDFNVGSLFDLSHKYVAASIIMFIACLISKVMLNMNAFSRGIWDLAIKLDIEYKFIFNICSIVVQVLVGMITYITTLIILKDDSIIKLIDKIKTVLHLKKDVTLQ